VAVEATRAIGDADPRAEDESCALVEHGTGEIEACHRILRWMLDEHPYPARQMLAFYGHAH
jgi:alpha/beta superfamily hydrolase